MGNLLVLSLGFGADRGSSLLRFACARVPDGHFGLTALGRLAGEGLCEVESIVRIVGVVKKLAPADLAEPALITLAQLSVELSVVHFPLNKKSIHKEPQAWESELRAQRVAGGIMGTLRVATHEPSQVVARMKKAVACLFYIGPRSMGEIEQILIRFGGAFDTAAGPIRAVSLKAVGHVPSGDRLRTYSSSAMHP